MDKYDLKTALESPWQAVEDNVIGGWCVILKYEERTPAEGAIQIVSFLDRHLAAHIANAHNAGLPPTAFKTDEDCPSCGATLRYGMGGGVKCVTPGCHYWFCY